MEHGMARVPYVEGEQHEIPGLEDRIRARRAGELLNLDRVLLSSPVLAEGWNQIAARMRNELQISKKLVELAICLVARLNGADYEFQHHLPLWRQAGATPAQTAAMWEAKDALDEAPFDKEEIAVIRLTTQMTRAVRVDEKVFRDLGAFLSARQLVELVGLVAFYNMVSRFLVALDVDPELPARGNRPSRRAASGPLRE
jgi:alkylhydroperoxidase family enzyme